MCLRVEGEEFIAVQNDDDTLTFLIDLGYKGPLYKYPNMYVDHMSQPWRTLAAIINKCLSGKTASNDRLRKSKIDIIQGIFYKENVDYPELSWEDFAFQIDHKSKIKSRCENMPFLRFIKVIINHFLLQHKSLSNLNYQHYHTIKDDGIETVDVSEESEPEPAKKKTGSRSSRGVVTQDTPSAPKTKPVASKPKLKGVQSLTLEEQEAADTMQALKERKKTSRRQPGTGGSIKGTSRIPGVLDESTMVSATSSEGTGTILGVPDEEKVTSKEKVILEQKEESDKSIDLEMTDDEETDDEFVQGVEQVNDDEDEETANAKVEVSRNGDEENTDAAKTDAGKTKEV
ncbi:hypothetical protein Tco_1475630 [Tanacetum coccineum]